MVGVFVPLAGWEFRLMVGFEFFFLVYVKMWRVVGVDWLFVYSRSKSK